jgi:hypothetical protein
MELRREARIKNQEPREKIIIPQPGIDSQGQKLCLDSLLLILDSKK